MRGLAEFAMSGRRKAATVAILFGLVPMLNLFSIAVVALVTLRKGAGEGFMVMLWALLPAGLQWFQGNSSPAMMLLAGLLIGNVLRATESWPKTLIVITALGFAIQLSLPLQKAYVAAATAIMEDMIAQGQAPQLGTAGELAASADAQQITALLLPFYGAYHILFMVAALAIARYWQALLYNPGGFKTEFHALRMDPRFMGLLLAMIALGEAGVSPFAGWVPLFCMAPLINGIALSHYLVAARKLSSGWLVLAYLMVFIMAPAMILLGFTDSFANLRKRLNPGQ